MRRLALLLLACASSAAAGPGAFGQPIADAELADLRGGIRLPGGIDLALAVESQTLVDGATLLRSIFTADTAGSQLTVLVGTPADAATAAAARAQGADDAGGTQTAAPTISYDRQQGLVVMPASTVSMPRVVVGVGAPATTTSEAGVQRIEIAAGQSIETAAGTLTRYGTERSGRIEIATADLVTNHLFGAAFGSLTTNTANDRAIDTSTTANLSLGNVSPDVLGSAILRVEGVAIETAQMLGR